MTEDRRRRQYVPLYVHFCSGPTGQKILGRFGMEGVGVWAAMLAAAKRSPIQGTFEWLSETDAWGKIGCSKRPPEFTFAEFVRFLGRQKLASTQKYGEVSQTSITAWREWNHTLQREQDADKKRRKRAQNTGDKTRDKAPTIRGTEGEGEGETPLPPRRRRTRAQPEHPLAITDDRNRCPDCGARQRTASELADHLKYVHGHQPAHPKAAA